MGRRGRRIWGRATRDQVRQPRRAAGGRTSSSRADGGEGGWPAWGGTGTRHPAGFPGLAQPSRLPSSWRGVAGHGVPLLRGAGQARSPGAGPAHVPARPRARVCSRPSPPAARTACCTSAFPRRAEEPGPRCRGARGGGAAGSSPGEAEAHEGEEEVAGRGVGGRGRITVAPPDPVTSPRARREPRATLGLREADSALAGGSRRPCLPSPRA